jgi:hypothetical protein
VGRGDMSSISYAMCAGMADVVFGGEARQSCSARESSGRVADAATAVAGSPGARQGHRSARSADRAAAGSVVAVAGRSDVDGGVGGNSGLGRLRPRRRVGRWLRAWLRGWLGRGRDGHAGRRRWLVTTATGVLEQERAQDAGNAYGDDPIVPGRAGLGASVTGHGTTPRDVRGHGTPPGLTRHVAQMDGRVAQEFGGDGRGTCRGGR